MPFPDYTMIKLEEYYNMDTSNWYNPRCMEIKQPFPIISSRSCPNKCSFCNMYMTHGSKIRYRTADNVIDEIKKLYQEYNVRYFQFMDDNMTFNMKRAIKLFEGILRNGIKIQFDTPNGLAINRLASDLIDVMIEAGMVSTSLAIESGSEYIRNKIMGKRLSTDKIYEVVEACAKHRHLFIKAFFIIGMPEETHETLDETYKMISRLPLDKINVNFVAPYPGTKLFAQCQAEGLLTFQYEDYLTHEIYQDSDVYPHFRPYNLSCEYLVKFRSKCFDYMKLKRSASALPDNFPLRYTKGKEKTMKQERIIGRERCDKPIG